MLKFRTILLWLAFLLLLAQYFIDIKNIRLGLIFRLTPSALLLLWFLLSVLIRIRVKIRMENISRPYVIMIKVFRPVASISIVLGALLKIMHWPFGNSMLVTGIGCMAVYSTIISHFATAKEAYDPDIIDDLGD